MIKGILFDKDGTLIEFSNLWRDSFFDYLNKKPFSNEEKNIISMRVGIGKDGSIIENSILASGTNKDIARILSEFIDKPKKKILKEYEKFVIEYIRKNPRYIKPTCDGKKLFSILEDMGYIIGVVTADSFEITKLIFEMLGYLKYFKFIATADVYPNKPKSKSLKVFCKQFGLSRGEIAMVGDSKIDMLYGKKAGTAIGVATGVGTRNMLSKYADYMVSSSMEILDIISEQSIRA